jgi:hypothetical protein
LNAAGAACRCEVYVLRIFKNGTTQMIELHGNVAVR